MKGAVYALAFVALLIGVQGYESIAPASEPTPEVIYIALFKNFQPHFIRDGIACTETFIKQDIQIIEIFGQGVRECLNITVEQFQALFDEGTYKQIAAQTKSQLTQCKAANNCITQRIDCYADAIVQYVREVGQVTIPYIRISVSCLKTQLKQLESQWYTAYYQLMNCYDELKN